MVFSKVDKKKDEPESLVNRTLALGEYCSLQWVEEFLTWIGSTSAQVPCAYESHVLNSPNTLDELLDEGIAAVVVADSWKLFHALVIGD